MRLTTLWPLALLACAGSTANAQDTLRPAVRPSGDRVQLRWPAGLPVADRTVFPAYRVEISSDLRTWTPAGPVVRGSGADAAEVLAPTYEATAPHAFFRLTPLFGEVAAATASGGADVFGYNQVFAEVLAEIGQITPEEFAARFPGDAEYLEGIAWDPTTAAYWDEFNIDPEEYNRGLIQGVDALRMNDFRLNREALDLFRQNGFVAVERQGGWEGESFADLFYAVWEDDLPVFVSADAILQAWHRSYDSMLEELEETFLYSTLDGVLEGMAAELPALAETLGGGALEPSLLDADYFLAVARSLLAGKPQSSALGQNRRVGTTLTAVEAGELIPFDLFGTCRTVDFSQFTVRGHYENSERLGRYFQAMMWCGRIDLRVAGGPFKDCDAFRFASPREMGTAVVLCDLLRRSGQFDAWRQFEEVVRTFVGWTDSMTFEELDALLTAAGIDGPADLVEPDALEALQRRVEAGDLGWQQIRGDFYVSPLGGEQLRLPRSFTVMGQKFVLDSWALGKLVYDDIVWDEDGVLTEADKVKRRVPSGLDVAFAVLGNDQTVPDLLARITNPDAAESADHSVRWRDGFPYQHNLAAVREVVERQDPNAWRQSLYTEWLATLRELSVPTTDVRYPQAMRTRAWAGKSLNTQLASWTHLRHDTLLYSKPTYTSVGECFYPAGYVEPIPHFWARLRDLAEHAAGFIEQLDVQGTATVQQRNVHWREDGDESAAEETDLSVLRSNQAGFLRRFAETVETLRRMAEMELAGEPFGTDEELFVRNLVENVGMQPAGCMGFRQYGGWYPQLFYQSVLHSDFLFHQDYGADKWDAVVVDVHTDPPDPGLTGDPGGVLHEGVGRAVLLMITVENGPEPTVYAGPVLSHYEFEEVGAPRRLSDNEWKSRFGDEDFPEPPPWTQRYFLPLSRP